MRRGRDADLTVANAYSNDGTPVFDAAASTTQSSRNLANGGERMKEIARALAGVAAVEDRYHRMATDATAAAAGRIDKEITAYDRVVANRASRIDEFGCTTTLTTGGLGTGRDRGLLGGLADLGAGAVNSAASLGNALLHNPLDIGGLVVGAAGFAAGSAVALAGGTVSLSGVGLTVGVPAAGAGAALAGAGGALILASAADLSAAASGPNRVDPVATGGDEPLTAEEKRAAVRNAVHDDAGDPVGNAGSNPRIREVSAEQFDGINESLRSQLGSPDRLYDIPGKGRVELWEVAPNETVTYRTFSQSGDRGVSGAETIEVRGPDDVIKIHYKEG